MDDTASRLIGALMGMDGFEGEARDGGDGYVSVRGHLRECPVSFYADALSPFVAPQIYADAVSKTDPLRMGPVLNNNLVLHDVTASRWEGPCDEAVVGARGSQRGVTVRMNKDGVVINGRRMRPSERDNAYSIVSQFARCTDGELFDDMFSMLRRDVPVSCNYDESCSFTCGEGERAVDVGLVRLGSPFAVKAMSRPRGIDVTMRDVTPRLAAERVKKMMESL